MSVDTTGISAVLARIAQIQAQIAPLQATAAGSATQTSFANTLATGLVGTETGSMPASSDTDATALSADPAAAVANPAAATASTSTGSGVTGSQVVTAAEKYLGVPYVFGGTTTSGLDCSGLVQKAYGDLGITLPRLSWDQAKVGTPVAGLAQAQPGDILGFGNPAHHVAIYLGNNQMIAAPEPGENVKIQSVYETPAEIRRVVGTSTAATGSTAGAALPAATTLATGTALPAATAPAAGTSTTAGLPSAISPAVQAYASQFASAEKSYSLPAGLLAAVAQTESAGNASAVSPAGAQGLMQLMPSMAAGLGVNAFDPGQSIVGAAKMFSQYLAKYDNSVPLSLAAYNAGPGAVAQYGGVPPYTETQNYVTKITGLMAAGG